MIVLFSSCINTFSSILYLNLVIHELIKAERHCNFSRSPHCVFVFAPSHSKYWSKYSYSSNSHFQNHSFRHSHIHSFSHSHSQSLSIIPNHILSHSHSHSHSHIHRYSHSHSHSTHTLLSSSVSQSTTYSPVTSSPHSRWWGVHQSQGLHWYAAPPGSTSALTFYLLTTCSALLFLLSPIVLSRRWHLRLNQQLLLLRQLRHILLQGDHLQWQEGCHHQPGASDLSQPLLLFFLGPRPHLRDRYAPGQSQQCLRTLSVHFSAYRPIEGATSSFSLQSLFPSFSIYFHPPGQHLHQNRAWNHRYRRHRRSTLQWLVFSDWCRSHGKWG